MVELEKRAYGPDSPRDVREAIRARVRIAEPGVIAATACPVESAWSIDVRFDRTDELARSMNAYSLVFDVSDSARPGADVREQIKSRIGTLPRGHHRLVIVVGRSAIMRAAVRFMNRQVGGGSWSVCKSLEQGLAEARASLPLANAQGPTAGEGGPDRAASGGV
jgi:hypothetical protein